MRSSTSTGDRYPRPNSEFRDDKTEDGMEDDEDEGGKEERLPALLPLLLPLPLPLPLLLGPFVRSYRRTTPTRYA